jgi:photosystem II stability/assembly factor-like uncharacterized protein
MHSQWVQLNTDTVHDYSAIYFLNKDTGFVCGIENFTSGDGIVLRTLNGGDYWDTIRLSGRGWLMDIQFLDINSGLTGGQDGGIYETSDMGLTWTPFPSCSFFSDFSSFYFLNNDTAFVLSFAGDLKRYTPGSIPACSLINYVGATGFLPGTGRISFFDNIGYVAGGNGIFLKTNDNGVSWQNFNCDSTVYVHDAIMVDQNQIVVVGGTAWTVPFEFGASMVSFNGGLTWTNPNVFSPHDILAVDFYNSNVGVCVGGYNSIFSTTNSVGSIWNTTDAGLSWSLVDSSYSDQLTDVLVVNDSLAFAVGMNGKILRNKTPFGSVGVNDLRPKSFSIYPNPFTNTFKIVHEILQYFVHVTIMNSSGVSVWNDNLLNGKELVIDSSLWPGGVYFVRIISSEQTTMHKIIKMK